MRIPKQRMSQKHHKRSRGELRDWLLFLILDIIRK